MFNFGANLSTKNVNSNPYLLEYFNGKPLLPTMFDKDGVVNYLAIDVGYHGIKIMTEEGITFIPNVACRRKEFGHTAGADPKSIVYKTTEGQEYFVGELALDFAKDGDIKDNERYSLDFITTPEFLAVFRSAVYIATKGNPSPFVSTGLPSSAFKEDKKYVQLLVDVLAKEHNFQIAVGTDVGNNINYKNVSFTIKKSNLFIYPQPIGTLASQGATIENGMLIPVNRDLLMPESRTTRTVIDGGFYTLDVHTMRKTNDILDKSFSYKGEGMISPYRKIKEALIENAKRDGFVPEYPIWQLSEKLEQEAPFLFDTGADEEFDATDIVNRVYDEYADSVGKRVAEDLNRGNGIEEIYITGGPAFILAPGLSKSGRIPERKIKKVQCNLNGIEIESRYFNVIGYFYLMAAYLADQKTSEEVAVSEQV